nr:hypothetical protein [Tanacetum cinerariifolium]
MNEDTSVVVAFVVKEGVTPFVVDITVEMEKISSLEDFTVLGSFPPLHTQGTIAASNAPGKSSYANVTGFKPQKEYRPIPKKPNASSIGNKKKAMKPTIEGTTNLVNNRATSSRSSFMNTDNDGEFACNTPIGEKIDKIERQIGECKLRLLDNNWNPLVPTGIMKSDSEMEVVFDETANLRISASGKDGSDKVY